MHIQDGGTHGSERFAGAAKRRRADGVGLGRGAVYSPSPLGGLWAMPQKIFKESTLRSRVFCIFTVRRSLHGICYSNSVRPFVCLSVRLSVTLVDCVHMVRPTIMISSPQGSHIILVSGDITIIPKFEGGHLERGR